MTEKETQVDKELLLKDLSARLPYGVLGQCEIDASYDTEFETIPQTHKFQAVAHGIIEDSLFVSPMIENQYELEIINEEIADGVYILDFKPYLFPLSSMTKEQLFDVQEIMGKNEIEIEDGFLSIIDSDRNTISYLEILALLEWFYKNHFDINGLIEKGLAIDATNLNIY